jgi:hypothetical protein
MDEIILLESSTVDGILLESGGTDVILLEYVAAPASSNQFLTMVGCG